MTCDEALALAVPDSCGVPWAQAKAEGRSYLVMGYAAGKVLVEIDAVTGEKQRRVVTDAKLPAGLAWEPVDTGGL